ncbi:MAG: hypothetical protein ACOC4G_07560 [Bacillota bacterium]
MTKGFILTAGLILLLLVIPAVFSAQVCSVEMEIETGFNNSYFDGSWIPISVILKNAESEFDGELLVIYPGKEGKTEYRFKVILPSSSRKIYQTVLPPVKTEENNGTEKRTKQYIEVQLRTEEGSVKSSRISLDEIDYKPANLLIIGEIQAGYNFIGQDEGTHIFYQKPGKLPLHALSYKGLKSIIIDKADLSHLDYLQQQALLNWLTSGGRILFTGPVLDYSASSNFFQRLIPGSYDGKKYLDFTREQLNYQKEFSQVGDQSKIPNLNPSTLEIYDYEPEEGENLISYQDIPLLWQKNIDGGFLRLLNIDPKKYHTEEWNNKNVFFEKLIQNDELTYMPENTGVLENYTDLMLNTTILQGPHKFIIILLLMIYISLIYYSYSYLFQGKNWSGLKKAGVILFIIFAFSAFIYLIPGRELLTENNIYKEYAFIRKNHSSNQAYFESYNLFFSSEVKKTFISSERDKAIFSNFSRLEDTGFSKTLSPEISADKIFLEINNDSNWVIEGFRSNFYEKLPINLKSEIEEDTLEIELQNESSYKISDIYIYHNGYWYQEDDSEIEDKYKYTFNLKSGSSTEPWPQPESADFKQNQENRLKAQILQEITEMKLGETDRSYLICVLEGNNTQMKVDTGKVPVKKTFNGFLQIPLE